MTMVEFSDFSKEHRQSLVTLIGTQSATILGPVPPQMVYEITEVVITGYAGGTVTGRLMQYATIAGYSQYGTVLGTIVEPFQVTLQEPFLDGNGRAPIAYVNPGNILYGQTDYGSCLAKVVYRPINQRGW